MSSAYKIESRHYHPRFWPVWLLLGLGWCVAQLPFRLQLSIGRGLGRLARAISRERRLVTRRNLEVCFPELSKAERRQLNHDAFDELGIGFIEIGLAYWGRPALVDPLCHLSGMEHIEQAQAEGKGVLLIAAHMTSLELCLRMFSERHPTAAMYKPAHNDLFEQYSALKRARYTKPVPNRSIRPFLSHMRRGGIGFYLPDQHYGSKISVFAPFFGVPTATIAKTPEFIKISGAKVIPVLFGRRDDGYHIEVKPAIEGYPTGDDVMDAALLNQCIENNIRTYPAQYLWQHRRFKSRPKGEPSIY
ncbi:MAG: lipid A biosynthesis lauroyl acyltransferase [Pseudomonadota bacterium]|nr:lipid A biosynthesis lauroyl acyltransferase [Pseudomonadota bacterium]